MLRQQLVQITVCSAAQLKVKQVVYAVTAGNVGHCVLCSTLAAQAGCCAAAATLDGRDVITVLESP